MFKIIFCHFFYNNYRLIYYIYKLNYKMSFNNRNKLKLTITDSSSSNITFINNLNTLSRTLSGDSFLNSSEGNIYVDNL